MKSIIPLLSSLLLFFTGCTEPDVPLKHQLPSSCTIYDMKQARCIDNKELVKRLTSYRVIFVGDHHAQTDLHQKLAKLIKSLDKSGHKVSLANEWFTPKDNTLLKHYASQSFKGDFTKAVEWKKKVGYDFDSYDLMYKAIHKGNGGLYGINLSHKSRKLISYANVSDMTKEERGFYDSLDLNITAHRQMLSPFFSHCHRLRKGENTTSCSERMYRVQVAWDSYMAKESVALLNGTQYHHNDILMVFAGAMHFSHGLGINTRFARLSPEPFVTIKPVPMGTNTADVGEADFLLFYVPLKKR